MPIMAYIYELCAIWGQRVEPQKNKVEINDDLINLKIAL